MQGIFNTAATILLNLLFLIPLRLGVTGYVLSVVIADALSTVFILALSDIRRDFSFRSVSGAKIREMLRYCAPLIPTTIFWWITNVSDHYLVLWINGEEANGLYTASYKIPTLLTLVAGFFNEAWQFSAIRESRDRDVLADFYRKVFRGFSSVIFLGCGVLILGAKVGARVLFASS